MRQLCEALVFTLNFRVWPGLLERKLDYFTHARLRAFAILNRTALGRPWHLRYRLFATNRPQKAAGSFLAQKKSHRVELEASALKEVRVRTQAAYADVDPLLFVAAFGQTADHSRSLQRTSEL